MNQVAESFAEAANEVGLTRDQQEHIARKLAASIDDWSTLYGEGSRKTLSGFDADEFEELANVRRG